MAKKERTQIQKLEVMVRWRDRRIARLESDRLTGALNRWSLDKKLKSRLSDVSGGLKRYGATFTYGLLLIDLDGFKAVNDGGGHQAGDSVLRNVSCVLKSLLRQSDELFRYGGDEFLIIARVRNQNDLMQMAERIRRAVAGSVTKHGERCWQVTASIGATLMGPEDTPEMVIERADLATYEAKSYRKEGGAWQFAW